MRSFSFSQQRGQSLIEALIAAGIGVIMIAAAAAILVSVVQSSAEAKRRQVATALAKELLENIQVVADQDWHTIDTLVTGSTNHYFITSAPTAIVSGEENIEVSSIVHTRYFYLEDTGRDALGAILDSGGINDPSTKKVTVAYSWTRGGAGTLSRYIVRSRNAVSMQQNWSGGPESGDPVLFGSSTYTRYATSAEVIITATGSIMLQGF